MKIQNTLGLGNQITGNQSRHNILYDNYNFITIEGIPKNISKVLNKLFEQSTVNIPMSLYKEGYSDYLNTFLNYISSCNNFVYRKPHFSRKIQDIKSEEIFVISKNKHTRKTYICYETYKSVFKKQPITLGDFNIENFNKLNNFYKKINS